MESTTSPSRRTRRTVSVVLGIVGGTLDLGVGLLILASGPMASSDGMGVSGAYVGAILLLLLGGVILGSTAQMIGTRQSPRRRSQGFLMIVYGVLMLVAGAAMLGRLLPTMQAPDVSGAAMIGVGLAMLYVGAMMRVAGWLGIVDNDEKFARVYAVVFGVGAGFVGDEVGLLLTFDNYYSELTFEFLVAALAFLILVALMIRYRKQILEEVFHLSRGERLTHVGVFLIGFSAILFAFDTLELGVPLILVGFALFVWGYRREHRVARKSGTGP